MTDPIREAAEAISEAQKMLIEIGSRVPLQPDEAANIIRAKLREAVQSKRTDQWFDSCRDAEELGL